ncbi:YeeE/YedE family protein [Fodinibius sediminis]|uniref:Uncharacterized protein n=1 Tax=Fodinibius sediminis TaxID=1214077 RepID=A0A521EM42_9BACT|nr:YeeE/YedE thiosulfate transporter family protein [Fodinibius sediminis]SMO84995.1 hypothetical protein SAMN06265218_11747 [Fodinibius sediminis]
MVDFLIQPWPWYVAGPLIGLTVPLLLFLGNKTFGVSSSLRHYCAACMPAGISYFEYDWKKAGTWNILFVAGAFLGGFLGGYIFENPEPVQISSETVTALREAGITSFQGLVPADIFNWENLLTLQGLTFMVLGGFLVGFGARYAGGCTSGHAISGIANLQLPSVVAAVGFFIGGLLVTHYLLPLLL